MKNLQLVNKYKIWFAVSLLVIVAGAVFALTSGLNLGIDFVGGTQMQLDITAPFESKDVKEVLADYKLDEDILQAGSEKTELIIRTKVSLDNDTRISITEAIQAKYPEAVFRGAEQFGPSVGVEIQKKALLAILYASIGMLLYITFRFEIVYGLSAIVALVHDILILLSIYAILGIPMNSSFIAAVLTVVGYSINDTIVVFDRVRENVKSGAKGDYFDIANLSLNQTITRSLNTSITTALVIGCLYFLGVDAIKVFALPLFAGVIAGTYSSIFIASPVWALIKTALKKRKAAYKAG